MAEPLKNRFGADVAPAIAGMVRGVHARFDVDGFVRDAALGYDALSLTERGWHLARALRAHLPEDIPRAMDILVQSSHQPNPREVASGMGSFLFMPHCFFVAKYGLAHFEQAMAAQHVLTQKFTCEFSIRPFLIHHTGATLARLHHWADDPSEHVRRLVSEGTRPRLPWAMRLPAFQADPAPVLALLERLKDDPALYVRRSVANNLNDIGKDNPKVLSDLATRWLKNASPQRAWIVNHALRWAVKQGDAGALKALGFGKAAQVEIANAEITPQKAAIGKAVTVSFDVHNPLKTTQDVMVDFAVHYIKANGASSPKVFKLKALSLAPGQTSSLRKTVSLVEMTTRKHYPGKHLVEALINGKTSPIGSFTLSKK